MWSKTLERRYMDDLTEIANWTIYILSGFGIAIFIAAFIAKE
jgi:hypothetical protein